MKIVFTHHAKYRLMERGISVDNVKKTIKEPDSRKMDEHGMISVRKIIHGKILEVVYKIQRNSQIIITVYYEN